MGIAAPGPVSLRVQAKSVAEGGEGSKIAVREWYEARQHMMIVVEKSW